MNKTSQIEPSAPDLKVAKKLTYHNYTRWCKLMHIAIQSRRRLDHIITALLSSASSNYQQWKQRDTIVLSWIITNIESDLINQFLDYNTT